MNEKIKAIVITEDHYNALGVLRSLGEKGVQIHLLLFSEGDTFVDSCRYVYETHKIKRTESAIIQSVSQIISSGERFFVFPLSDFSANILDKNYVQLGEKCIIPNMRGKMNFYLYKHNTKEKAQEYGLLVPKGCILSKDEENADWDVFPAIVKPLISIEGKKSDIITVANRTELNESIKSFREKGYSNFLLEQFIEGDDEYMIEVMGYRGKGTTEVCGIIKKIREYPIQNGSTSYAEVVEEHEAISCESVKRFVDELDFFGLFDMEFKYADGKAYFIECNFRNGAPGYALTKRGRNIPFEWILDVLEEKSISSRSSRKKCFMCEQTDIINMLKGTPGVFTWCKQFFCADKIFFSWKDLKPVITYYVIFIKKFLRK